MKYFVHESSYIDDGAKIGEGTKIWHFSHIMSKAIIGKNCNIGLYEGVIIEDDVFIGPSSVFTNVRNPRAFVNRKEEYASTFIRRGSTIGANATIICGVIIGEYSFVGAGSVVTKDVPAYSIVYGVPAEVKSFISANAEEFGQ